MTTDDRNHQGQRLKHSQRIAGIALILMLYGSLFFIAGCGHGPTEPAEQAVYLPCGVRNVPVTPGDPTVPRCANDPRFVAIIERNRIGRTDTMPVIP